MSICVAKFKVLSVDKSNSWTPSVFLHLEAVTDQDTEENKTWSKYTPSGQLNMTITNEELFDSFSVGQEILLTLSEI